MNILLLLILLTAGGFFCYLIIYIKPRKDDWQELPTLTEYLSEHPECETDDPDNAKCFCCDSYKVIFRPLRRHPEDRYKHVCLSCSTALFRSNSIMS